ncbi:MAG: cytochrome c-type biogenesis protein CcmH [Ilumatobacteraceae bacterium]
MDTRRTRSVRRVVWGGIALVTIAALSFGSLRDAGPLTQQDRIDSVTKRIACPTCDGESVFVSRASAAQAIRAEVARQVGDGVRSDDEIVAYIADRFGGEVLLVPRGEGLDALIWVLPVLVSVVLIIGLAAAFRRWRRVEPVAPSRRRSWMVGVGVAIVVGVGGGVLVARQAGQRLPLQTATGGIEDSTASLLAQARLAGGADVTSAIELYGRVLETDPDNVEALTYRAWLIMLSARQFDESLRNQAYASTITALGRAIELDPGYPDAMCFLGIVVFRDGGDAASAKEFVDRCLDREPPAEVRGLVEALKKEVDDVLGE